MNVVLRLVIWGVFHCLRLVVIIEVGLIATGMYVRATIVNVNVIFIVLHDDLVC